MEGHTSRKIVACFDISAEGVRKIVNKLEKNGTVENLRKSERPRKPTSRQNHVIVREVFQNRSMSTKQLKSSFDLPIQETQIQARIKETG